MPLWDHGGRRGGTAIESTMKSPQTSRHYCIQGLERNPYYAEASPSPHMDIFFNCQKLYYLVNDWNYVVDCATLVIWGLPLTLLLTIDIVISKVFHLPDSFYRICYLRVLLYSQNQHYKFFWFGFTNVCHRSLTWLKFR